MGLYRAQLREMDEVALFSIDIDLAEYFCTLRRPTGMDEVGCKETVKLQRVGTEIYQDVQCSHRFGSRRRRA